MFHNKKTDTKYNIMRQLVFADYTGYTFEFVPINSKVDENNKVDSRPVMQLQELKQNFAYLFQKNNMVYYDPSKLEFVKKTEEMFELENKKYFANSREVTTYQKWLKLRRRYYLQKVEEINQKHTQVVPTLLPNSLFNPNKDPKSLSCKERWVFAENTKERIPEFVKPKLESDGCYYFEGKRVLQRKDVYNLKAKKNKDYVFRDGLPMPKEMVHFLRNNGRTPKDFGAITKEALLRRPYCLGDHQLTPQEKKHLKYSNGQLFFNDQPVCLKSSLPSQAPFQTSNSSNKSASIATLLANEPPLTNIPLAFFQQMSEEDWIKLIDEDPLLKQPSTLSLGPK